jgi:hypothetical protein
MKTNPYCIEEDNCDKTCPYCKNLSELPGTNPKTFTLVFDKELILIDGIWWSSIGYYEEVKNTLSFFGRESTKN